MYTYRGYPDNNHLDHQNKKIRPQKLEGSGEDRESKEGSGREEEAHRDVNLPASPSEGVSAKSALGSSRYTRSWGILRESRLH
jgi:hypothetical protein